MTEKITTYEMALLRVAEWFAKPRHPKGLGIVHFLHASGSQRFRVYPYRQSSQYALRDSKIGESFELVAIACDNAPLQVLSKVAYRPLSVRDAIACYVGEDFYHLKNECWPDRKVCLFTLGDEANGADSTIFSRLCAACGKLILQDDTLRAAQSFFAKDQNG